MAIVVPFLVNAGATALGMSATAATIASVATSVVFSVTGVNDKINKAASKVFGEDLVQFANIAGAAYSMWNGGFDMGDGAESLSAVDPNAMNVPTDGAALGDAFEAQMAGFGESPTSISAADGGGGASFDVDAGNVGGASSEQFNLQQMAESGDAFEQDMTDMMAGKETISDIETTDMLTGNVGGQDVNPLTPAADPTPVQSSTASATTDQFNLAATQQSAASPSATGVRAAGNVGMDATGKIGLQAPPNALSTAGSGGGNNFSELVKKLLYNKSGDLNAQLIGGLLQGGGAVTASYLQRRAQQQAADQQQARRNTRPVMNYL